MSRSPRRVLAAVLATAVGGGVLAAVPASAHNPRNTPEGAPRMDLEVMVTPELDGRITPGGTDPVVSVDGFGNRFVVARKEDAQTLVGVDQRARTMTRASAWAWTSYDDGLTWENLDLLPRGAEQLLPQGVARDVASGGGLTLLAESHGATVVVHRLEALGKGRLGAVGTTVVDSASVPGGFAADVAVATNGRDGVVASSVQGGPSTVTRIDEGSGFVTASVGFEGACDVAADPRPATRTFWVACLETAGVVLHSSTNAGADFTRRAVLPIEAGPSRPQVDVGPDGTPYVLSGTTLVRLRDGRAAAQDLQVPGRDVRGVAFAVSSKGRVAATAYTRAAPKAPWHVQVALFTPGSRPVWYDFSDHDPADSGDAASPPSQSTSVDTDPLGRLQMVWASTFAHTSAVQGEGLYVRLRNVFTARSVTS